VTGLLLAAAAAAGAFYLYTALHLGWRGLGPGPGPGRPSHFARATTRPSLGERFAGLGAGAGAGAGAGPATARDLRQIAATGLALAAAGGVVGLAVFGGRLPALVLAGCGGAVPVASARVRAAERRAAAQEAWPRLLEEVRILTTSLGRSVPQALFDAGRSAPDGLRPAFEAAHREWLLSTDFARTVAVLKAGVADPTADAACETLLVAHEVGGTDLDRRLAALIEDRILDVQGRKDARSRQAGVRFARNFTVVVPFGMALVGMSIGDGRAAYASPGGQVLVVAGIAAMIGCWVWAGRLLALPAGRRVFDA
jgi:tight adherence protein B